MILFYHYIGQPETFGETMSLKFSAQEALILEVIRSQPEKWWASLEIMDTCRQVDASVHVNQGNLYPALRMLTANCFAVDRWENEEEKRIRIQIAGSLVSR